MKIIFYLLLGVYWYYFVYLSILEVINIRLFIYHLSAYKKASQAEVMKKLLGTNNLLADGTQIIDTSSSGTNYFARGHLSPDAAFIEGPEQDATYYFFNVAPQFQSFNNGNWKALEYVTRKMAEM